MGMVYSTPCNSPCTHTPRIRGPHPTSVMIITMVEVGLRTSISRCPVRLIRVSSDAAVDSREADDFCAVIAEGSFRRKTPRITEPGPAGFDQSFLQGGR